MAALYAYGRQHDIASVPTFPRAKGHADIPAGGTSRFTNFDLSPDTAAHHLKTRGALNEIVGVAALIDDNYKADAGRLTSGRSLDKAYQRGRFARRLGNR